MVKPLAYKSIAYPLFSQIIVCYPGPIHAQLVVHAPKRAYRAPGERQLEGAGQVSDFVNRVFIQNLTRAARREIRKERRPRGKVGLQEACHSEWGLLPVLPKQSAVQRFYGMSVAMPTKCICCRPQGLPRRPTCTVEPGYAAFPWAHRRPRLRKRCLFGHGFEANGDGVFGLPRCVAGRRRLYVMVSIDEV